MLLCFMYHRVGTGKYSNTLAMLRSHLEFLKAHYPIVLPGEPLSQQLSICLTFDDATYDFYHYVFPLLQEFNLRALLGVPVRYILDDTSASPQTRLEVPYPLMMQDGIFDTKAPLCTWKELQEMVHSGHVQIASHAYAHCNLTFPFVDLHKEIITSKEVLEAKLPQAITSFIYPFGRSNSTVQQLVHKHYPYAFRIGSALNPKWQPLICRIPADNMTSPTQLFHWTKRMKYWMKMTKLQLKN